MEAVASAFAVVSLSLQLLQHANTIKAFMQGIKHASAEIQRVIQTLEALGSLLNELKDFLELQNAHLAQDAPPPSPAIINCITRCEEHLQPLKDLVDKYSGASKQDGSRTDKLRDRVRLSFKRKNIADIENNIHREMTILSAAIALNHSRIGFQNLLAVARVGHQVNAQTLMYQTTAYSVEDIGKSQTAVCQKTPSSHSDSLRARYSRRNHHQWFSLGPFSFRKRTVQHIQWIPHDDDNTHDQGMGKVISKETTYTLASGFIGYGLDWTLFGPMGTIRSLNVYPIFPDHVWSKALGLFFSGNTVEYLRAAFDNGEMHPFMQDEGGRSLLHYAAGLKRADICQFLLTIGLQLRQSNSYFPPFLCALAAKIIFPQIEPRSTVDTLRVLDEEVNEEETDSTIGCFLYVVQEDFEAIEWTMDRVVNASHGVSDIHSIKAIVRALGSGRFTDYFGLRLATVINRNRDFLLSVIQSTEILSTFFWKPLQCESAALGDIWICILQSYGINIENYLLGQLEARPNGIMKDASDEGSRGSRGLRIEHAAGGTWTLDWEWVYEQNDPGFLILSEHRAIIHWSDWCNVYGILSEVSCEELWPFYDIYSRGREELKQERFERRMSRKARKELNRTGQKVSRRKMPGTWID